MPKCRPNPVRWGNIAGALLVMGPMAATYWRGVWNLLDIYLFPNDEELSAWLSAGFGVTILILESALQQWLNATFPMTQVLTFAIVSRLYLIISAFANVCYWRGLYNVLVVYTDGSWEIQAMSVLFGLGVLYACRLSTWLLISPLVTNSDAAAENFFCVHTRFRVPPGLTCAFICDTILSAAIIPGVSLVAWRGLWSLYDLYAWPDDPLTSALFSLALGYGLCLTLFIASPLIPAGSSLGSRVVVQQVISFFGVNAGLHIWRGFWMLQDEYFLWRHYSLSSGLSAAIGTCVPLALGCFASNIAGSAMLDGEDEEGFALSGRFLDACTCCQNAIEPESTSRVHVGAARSGREEHSPLLVGRH